MLKEQAMPMKNPAHPGEVLREYIDSAGITVGQAAEAIAYTRPNLSKVLNGRADVETDLAIKLSLAFGTSAEFWLNMQMNYDLAQARKKPRPKVKKILNKEA